MELEHLIEAGAIIVPIHDSRDDFNHGYQLVSSIKNLNAANHVYFIFSDAQQRRSFEDVCLKKIGFKANALIYPQSLVGCRNAPTVKKLFALNKLRDQYRYIAAIDCESVFIQDFVFGLLLKKIWDSQTFLSANRSVKGAEIVRKCAESLGLDKNQKLIKQTDNFRYAWWFNEIPVYSVDNLDLFFKWLEMSGKRNKVYNDWNCFDYIVYVIWLIVEADFKLRRLDYKCETSIVEELWRPEIFRKVQIEKKLGVHWTTRVKPNSKENANIYMQFHRDRRSRGALDCVYRVMSERFPWLKDTAKIFRKF